MKTYDHNFFNLFTHTNDFYSYINGLSQKDLIHFINEYKLYVLEIESSKKGLRNEINNLYKQIDLLVANEQKLKENIDEVSKSNQILFEKLNNRSWSNRIKNLFKSKKK